MLICGAELPVNLITIAGVTFGQVHAAYFQACHFPYRLCNGHVRKSRFCALFFSHGTRQHLHNIFMGFYVTQCVGGCFLELVVDVAIDTL